MVVLLAGPQQHELHAQHIQHGAYHLGEKIIALLPSQPADSSQQRYTRVLWQARLPLQRQLVVYAPLKVISVVAGRDVGVR